MSRSGVSSPVGFEDRSDIISMIDSGWTDAEILECMPHVELGSVSAFRAHVTRGTYSQGELKWKITSD